MVAAGQSSVHRQVFVNAAGRSTAWRLPGAPPRRYRNIVAQSQVLHQCGLMRIVTKPHAMQQFVQRWRLAGWRIGFVPTMGYLHEGHLSLVREARRRAGRRSRVALSIYVNPTQFAPHEDLAKYPRDFERDCALCRQAGVDVVFAPESEDIYPPGNYSTFVTEEQLSKTMEGACRPTHFRGVTTIVAKLFNLVLPHVAVFGAKDFQQAAVVRRMSEDLNFPVQVVVAPTVREADGLAMSSRNKYLVGDLRQQALVLWRALQFAKTEVQTRGPVRASALRRGMRRIIEEAVDARVDYIEFVDPRTLEARAVVGPGTQATLAVFVGKTRLIDNLNL
jgi:pantoate--beta-alanine ligase